jgi:mannosyltransferase
MPQDYVLFVGSRASYKNFKNAVLAVKQHTLDLVVAGSVGLAPDEVDYLNSHLPGRWSFVDAPTSERLCELYQDALCLIYPSSYEGFGIPVLEAARCGTPVVACRNSSIPEVAGPSTVLVEKAEPSELAAALTRITEGVSSADRIAGINHACGFSWARTYTETRDCYTKALY